MPEQVRAELAALRRRPRAGPDPAGAGPDPAGADPPDPWQARCAVCDRQDPRDAGIVAGGACTRCAEPIRPPPAAAAAELGGVG